MAMTSSQTGGRIGFVAFTLGQAFLFVSRIVLLLYSRYGALMYHVWYSILYTTSSIEYNSVRVVYHVRMECWLHRREGGEKQFSAVENEFSDCEGISMYCSIIVRG